MNTDVAAETVETIVDEPETVVEINAPMANVPETAMTSLTFLKRMFITVLDDEYEKSHTKRQWRPAGSWSWKSLSTSGIHSKRSTHSTGTMGKLTFCSPLVGFTLFAMAYVLWKSMFSRKSDHWLGSVGSLFH